MGGGGWGGGRGRAYIGKESKEEIKFLVYGAFISF